MASNPVGGIMIRSLALCFVIFLFCGPVGARTHKARPNLKGSPRSILKQNKIADKENLTRIQNRSEQQRFRQKGLLVSIPQNKGIVVDSTVPPTRQVCRKETAKFVRDLGIKFHKQFPHEPPLRVTSALRTIEEQQRLKKNNPNAIRATGPMASSHPTGATVDIGRGKLSREQDAWLSFYLYSLKTDNKIEAVKENSRPCYHVMVFKSYLNTPSLTARAKHKKRSGQNPERFFIL